MAVTSYVGKNGATLWKVSVSVRSSNDPSIRVQKAMFGFQAEHEAKKEESKLLRVCERSVLVKESQGSSWRAVLESWEKNLDEKLSATTRKDYVAVAYKYTASWLPRPASSITSLDVKELLFQLKASGRTYGYIKLIKNLLGRIFTYGIERRLIRDMDRPPTFGIQLGKPEEKRPEILTLAEIRKLLQSARDMQHPWYHHWALALLTGMRSGELYALLWTDIDWENSCLTVSKSYNNRFDEIKSTKAGYWRTVPISTELRALLAEIKLLAGDRSSVLPRHALWKKGMQARELRKFCIGLGLPSVRFHALRACFATQLIRNGVPPIQIQKICGWKDLKTMQRYIRMAGIEVTGATEALKVLPEPEIMAKVVDLFSGDPVR
ncbi:MAG: site-specific integrase [Bdellovibrionaceae bacterium]|nr:site-specific integrase [Pseudobdellovibrionaceae bacterium]